MVKLIIICGISFAGKSCLGKAISETFGYNQVDVDEVKFQLYGLDVIDTSLGQMDWVRIYTETDSLIEGYLQSGKTAIDASRNFKRSERQLARQLANMLTSEFITIFVDTLADVARERLLQNRKTNSRRDVSDEGFEEILLGMEPPLDDESPLIFHHGDVVHRWISKNRSILSKSHHQGSR